MAKSGVDVAIAKLDAGIAVLQREIAGLERAKELVREASEPSAEKPKRGRKPRKGLPTDPPQG
jgi:hypothetical protein